LEALENHCRTDLAREIWETALRSRWVGPSVWFHGDVAPGNLLVSNGALSAVIDFGTCGVGDPACDLAIAWTLLTDDSRRVFRDRLCPGDDTWDRGRGWALWKSLVSCAGELDDGGPDLPEATYVLEQIFEEYLTSSAQPWR
jgi:aminoglycoside phosphotransferase (APT) family kinase protein